MEQKRYPVPKYVHWLLICITVTAIIWLPLLKYRWVYRTTKRIRVVEPGVLYRSGRMTGEGLEKTLKNFKIRTVVNLMDEETAPQLSRTYFGGGTVSEKEICRRLGVRYIFLKAETVPKGQAVKSPPKSIEEFSKIVSDPKNHPVLLHCRAGLHRTGILTAAYRMKFDGWSPTRAWKEMKRNGFGENNCFVDNVYIQQYIHAYGKKLRDQRRGETAETSEVTTPLSALVNEINYQTSQPK